MEVDENEGDVGARLRPIFCSLGEITRADGSVMLCQVVWCELGPWSGFNIHAYQGDTTVACSVFGPGEVRQARELIDRYMWHILGWSFLNLPKMIHPWNMDHFNLFWYQIFGWGVLQTTTWLAWGKGQGPGRGDHWIENIHKNIVEFKFKFSCTSPWKLLSSHCLLTPLIGKLNLSLSNSNSRW